MRKREKVFNILSILVFIFTVLNLNISHKTFYEVDKAEAILKDSYAPIEKLIKNLEFSKKYKLLKLPQNIKNKKDFISMFNNKIDKDEINYIYEELVVKKNDMIYINPFVYIPNIYSEDSYIKTAYIKYEQKIIDKILNKRNSKEIKLVVKLKLSDDNFFASKIYFIKNKKYKWVLDSQNFKSIYKYTEIENNPWNIYWSTE